MESPYVTSGDLHKSFAFCHAVYTGDGEPPEWLQTLLNDFNKNHKLNGAEPQDVHVIVQALKGCNVHVLIGNSIKTFDTYWVLTNLGCHITVAQVKDLYRIDKSIKKTDGNDSMELAAYMRRRFHEENESPNASCPPRSG